MKERKGKDREVNEYSVSESYLSLCFGQKYPEDRMLRDRMFGSMMVSSASGVFRMRPEVKRVTMREEISF